MWSVESTLLMEVRISISSFGIAQSCTDFWFFSFHRVVILLKPIITHSIS